MSHEEGVPPQPPLVEGVIVAAQRLSIQTYTPAKSYIAGTWGTFARDQSGPPAVL